MTRSSSDDFHRPVLVSEVVRHLVTDCSGVYLDLTVGGGGHLNALSEQLSGEARLYGIDRDSQAVTRATKELRGAPQVIKIERGWFGNVSRMVEAWKDRSFTAILLDIGLSSAQIDQPERGFSYRHDGPLDMRMDDSRGESAAALIDRLDEKELTKILREFGEERKAARIAEQIVMERQKEKISTTGKLAAIVGSVVGGPHLTKSLARVFQAFRIYINRELEQLDQVLPAAVELLKPSGRVAVISYHSLEDRLVKQFLRSRSRPQCTCPPGLPVCRCGAKAVLRLVTKRAIKAGDIEIAINSRARSARLRIAEKL